jgi:hypothetical protein
MIYLKKSWIKRKLSLGAITPVNNVHCGGATRWALATLSFATDSFHILADEKSRSRAIATAVA